jgi:hypothetical protein
VQKLGYVVFVGDTPKVPYLIEEATKLMVGYLGRFHGAFDVAD